MPKDEAEEKLKKIRKELSEEVATEVKAEMDSGDDKDENDDKEVKEEKKKPEFAKPETGRPREDQIGIIMPAIHEQQWPPGAEIPDPDNAIIREGISGERYVRWEEPPNIAVEFYKMSNDTTGLRESELLSIENSGIGSGAPPEDGGALSESPEPEDGDKSADSDREDADETSDESEHEERRTQCV